MVKDIFPGSTGSIPNGLTNVNGTLFFEATDSVHGSELWKSNGAGAGTVLVKDINPGSGSSFPDYLTNVNGTLFFNATDVVHGRELWRSNGSATGTVLVKDINPGTHSSSPEGLTNVNGSLFFGAFEGTYGGLWTSNGTAAGTFFVKDISAVYQTNVNGTLFFSANDGTHGSELWSSNGSAAGTFLVKDINPGSGSSYPRFLTNVNGTLFFSADDGVHGVEPWVLGPVPASAPAASALILPPLPVPDSAAGFVMDTGAAGFPLATLTDQQCSALESDDGAGHAPGSRKLASVGTGATEFARHSPAALATKRRSRGFARRGDKNESADFADLNL